MGALSQLRSPCRILGQYGSLMGNWELGIGNGKGDKENWGQGERLVVSSKLLSPCPSAPLPPLSSSSHHSSEKWKKRCEVTSQRFFQEGIIFSRP